MNGYAKEMVPSQFSIHPIEKVDQQDIQLHTLPMDYQEYEEMLPIKKMEE